MTDTRLFGEAAFEMNLVSTAQLYEALTVRRPFTGHL
jgi:hypothetical protein